MRKQGEYILDKRLRFKNGLQRKFIGKIKKGTEKTWNGLAEILGISDHTIRIEWYTEITTLPYKKAKKLLSLFPFCSWEVIIKNWVREELPPGWGQKLCGGKKIKKIKKPKQCEALAEILGVILGDGHLERKTLKITGNLDEIFHHYYVSNTIKNLFRLNSSIIALNDQHTSILRVYSIELINYLQNNGMVIGNKIKNKARLPKWIFKRKEFVYAVLRGLFDTDGGIYYKQKKYKRAIIEFQTKSPYIRRDIILLLKIVGFTSSKSATKSSFLSNTTHNIRIQNQEEVRQFFRVVGSSNPKNIIRYRYFISGGYIPLKEELRDDIRDFNGAVPYFAALV